MSIIYRFLMLITMLMCLSCSWPSSKKDKSSRENHAENFAPFEHKVVKKGIKLESVINFSNVREVKINNIKGFYQLSDSDWQKLQGPLRNAEFVGGVLCKPQRLFLTFIFENEEELTGTICDNLINFDDEITGSFKFLGDFKFHNL